MNLYSEWLLNGQPSVIELAGIAPEARWMIPDQRSSQPKELPMILEISKAEKQHSHQVGGLSLNPSQNMNHRKTKTYQNYQSSDTTITSWHPQLPTRMVQQTALQDPTLAASPHRLRAVDLIWQS